MLRPKFTSWVPKDTPCPPWPPPSAAGGEDSKRRQPSLPSAQEGWLHFSLPSRLASPGTSQKLRFYTPQGWTSFSIRRVFSHPTSSGKLSSGAAFYLWSLKHSSVLVLKTKSKKCIQVQMSETDKSEDLYSHDRKCFVSFFLYIPFLKKGFPVLSLHGQRPRY